MLRKQTVPQNPSKFVRANGEKNMTKFTENDDDFSEDTEGSVSFLRGTVEAAASSGEVYPAFAQFTKTVNPMYH